MGRRLPTYRYPWDSSRAFACVLALGTAIAISYLLMLVSSPDVAALGAFVVAFAVFPGVMYVTVLRPSSASRAAQQSATHRQGSAAEPDVLARDLPGQGFPATDHRKVQVPGKVEPAGTDGDGSSEAPAATHSHILWIGCGDLLRRTTGVLGRLRDDHGARFTFIDVCDAEHVKQAPLPESPYYDVSSADQRSVLRKHLLEEPVSHVFVANPPPQHLLTAFKYSELVPGGQIVIAEPLDTNIALIETIASSNAWPDLTGKISVHAHYRSKGGVEPTHRAFPRLIELYGRVMSFEFYLIERRTVEEEDRLEALNVGVIFDLATHLFALAQLFFLDGTPALRIPGLTIRSTSMNITRVARARYALCRIENQEAETFAAIEVEIIVVYSKSEQGRQIEHRIPGLMVVGKGIKPEPGIDADLKGMRFSQELQPRCVNLVRNEVSPPLTDLDFYIADRDENGLGRSLVTALSSSCPSTHIGAERVSPVMSFMEAAQNARFLGEAISRASPLIRYSVGETLEAVLAKCVASGALNARWLSDAGYADIGFG